MKILQLLPRYLPHEGGIERVMAQLCPELRQSNMNSTIVTDNFSNLTHSETIDGTNIYRFSFTQALMSKDPLAILKTQKSFSLLLKKLNPDVIHLHSVAQASIFFLLQFIERSNPKTKLVITQHGVLEEVDKTLVAEKLFGIAEMLTAVSSACANSIQSFTGIDKKIIIIPNGVTDNFNSLANSSRGLPKPSEPIHLICVGRVEAEKGFDIAIKCMAILRSYGLKASLQIVGTGTQLTPLKQLSAQLDLGELIIFHGEQSHHETQLLISQAHLILVPSRQREGFGLVVAEAASYGVPAIVANTGGLNETVIHNETGVVISNLTPITLADTIRAIYHTPQQYQAFSKAAYQQAKHRFKFSQWVDRYVNLYHSCLSL